MRLFLTGDTHGRWDCDKIFNFNEAHKDELTKEDVMFILGDFGAIFQRENKELLDKYEACNFATFFLAGNHEDYHLLNQYPKQYIEAYGCMTRAIRPGSIYMVMNGEVCSFFDDYNFLVMGGATSIDKVCRIEGIDWWPEEIPSDTEKLHCLENCLQKNIDFILTHTPCAIDINKWTKAMHKYLWPQDEYAEWLNILKRTLYLKWYSAHMHSDNALDLRTRIIYNDIIEILPDGDEVVYKNYNERGDTLY